MNILVIGAGYVGLVSAACMAEMGHIVICLDIDRSKIENLAKGIVPMYEPDLNDLITHNLQARRLSFTTSYEESVPHAQVCFIAVPTPSREDGSCDLRYVFEAAKSIAEHIHEDAFVAIKSTVPVGTAQKVKEIVGTEVVSNPEFLKEGAAVQDCMQPPRIIVGTSAPKTAAVMRELYAPLMMDSDRILFMSTRSAELTKYAANAMHATRITFMNELANLCEELGANIHEVRDGIGSDPRIGHQFLYAGVGFGGSCFPKDLRALQSMSRQVGATTCIIDAVNKVNQSQKLRLAEKMQRYFADGIDGKTIAIWGLSFKPETDDMREAPALDLIHFLLHEGANLRLFDPVALKNAEKILPQNDQVCLCQSEYEAAEKVDAIALVTEWEQFRCVDFVRIKRSMHGKGFFDGRNQYESCKMKELGFDYFAIGLPDPFVNMEMDVRWMHSNV